MTADADEWRAIARKHERRAKKYRRALQRVQQRLESLADHIDDILIPDTDNEGDQP